MRVALRITPRQLLPGDAQLALIPKAYQDASLDDFPKGYEGLSDITRFTENACEMVSKGVGLLLHGPMGHGKSRLAVVALKHAMRHNAVGLFLEAGQLATAILDRTEFEGDAEGGRLITRAGQVPFLVLDDLGAEHSSPFGKRAVEGLLRTRTTRRLSTIVTTNLKLDELEPAYGAGLLAILRERCFPVRVRGHDYREDEAAKVKKLFD